MPPLAASSVRRGDLQLDGQAAVGQQQPRRIVGDQVHQHLLHAAEHAVAR